MDSKSLNNNQSVSPKDHSCKKLIKKEMSFKEIFDGQMVKKLPSSLWLMWAKNQIHLTVDDDDLP